MDHEALSRFKEPGALYNHAVNLSGEHLREVLDRRQDTLTVVARVVREGDSGCFFGQICDLKLPSFKPALRLPLNPDVPFGSVSLHTPRQPELPQIAARS
jgi:hypothetical protein